MATDMALGLPQVANSLWSKIYMILIRKTGVYIWGVFCHNTSKKFEKKDFWKCYDKIHPIFVAKNEVYVLGDIYLLDTLFS